MFRKMLYDWLSLTALGNWKFYSEPTIECVDYLTYIFKKDNHYFAHLDGWNLLVGNTPRQALDQLYRLNNYKHEKRK